MRDLPSAFDLGAPGTLAGGTVGASGGASALLLDVARRRGAVAVFVTAERRVFATVADPSPPTFLLGFAHETFLNGENLSPS